MSAPFLAAGQSAWFSRQLTAHPEWAGALSPLVAAPLTQTVLEDLIARERIRVPWSDAAALGAGLRRVRNLWVAALMERDLSGRAGLDEVMEAMTCLADTALCAALDVLHRLLVARHGVPQAADGTPLELIVVAMGKLGGRELNVSSDIDLVFLYAEDGGTMAAAGQKELSNAEFFGRLGRSLIAALAEVTEAGIVFRVDMRLRPNGDAGPIAVSLPMLEDYFLHHGRSWERFAWIKARVAAPGGAALAAAQARVERLVTPFVYRRYLDFDAIEAMRRLHDRIRAEVDRRDLAKPDRSDNIKMGRGGIREIEFIAQHFQLVRGGRDFDLRERGTLATLARLATLGQLAPAVAERLAEAYVLYRNVEHRLQYMDDRQTHSLPRDAEGRARLAATTERLVPGGFAALAERLAAAQAFVAAEFDALFGARPAPRAASRPAEGATPPAPVPAAAAAAELPDDAARLAALGYPDGETALARLKALAASARVRALAPHARARLDTLVQLAIGLSARHAQENCNATQLLGRVLDLFEAVATRSAYLALLAEYPLAFERVVIVLAASSWAARYLIAHPILMDELLDTRAHELPDWGEVRRRLNASLARVADDVERQMDLLRETHHVETFGLLIQDLEGRLPVETLSDQLAALADLIIESALERCWCLIEGPEAGMPPFAVIAYGKLGGKELGYASDLDLVFLADSDRTGVPAEALTRLAQRLVTWLTSRTTAGALFDIDLRLRPDGAAGLTVAPVSGFERYQREQAWVWEHQALTRARFCAGDPVLGARFEAERASILSRPRDLAQLQREIAAMRLRMHEGHPNVSGLFDLKHDAGGMVDIEFSVQYLVLGYANRCPELLDNRGNIALLGRAAARGLIDPGLAERVAQAYRAYRVRQHGLRLAETRFARVPSDEFAAERADVSALFRGLGLAPGPAPTSGPPAAAR